MITSGIGCALLACRTLGSSPTVRSERIAGYADGNPRVVNIICDHCLLFGYADQKQMIDHIRGASYRVPRGGKTAATLQGARSLALGNGSPPVGRSGERGCHPRMGWLPDPAPGRLCECAEPPLGVPSQLHGLRADLLSELL